MSVFGDFRAVWAQRFPGSELPAAWEQDVRANLSKHRQRAAVLREELDKEQFYVEYLERLLADVERHRDEGTAPGPASNYVTVIEVNGLHGKGGRAPPPEGEAEDRPPSPGGKAEDRMIPNEVKAEDRVMTPEDEAENRTRPPEELLEGRAEDEPYYDSVPLDEKSPEHQPGELPPSPGDHLCVQDGKSVLCHLI
ncbi:hypothetical protein PR048_015340 [Dryococelus australis]|uniref:Bcr-Abl oncoprotein oligomerisation domain-containing protein n=1 Tax=Dryococelus australis TaxID=614101 RepID=A0ABQ9HGP3_9NEOP|nr:hypothetical protein PR048_015340 [Dryococelus australis]